MKSHVLMVLALCGLITISCSQKKNKKRKEVLVEARLIAPVLTNYNSGIFFGKNAQGEVFSHWISDNTFAMTFPNSVYDFAIIAWNGGTAFSGTSFCDVKPGISLEGGDISLTFNLATGNCSNGIFGRPESKAPNGSILPSVINTCANFRNQILEEQSSTGAGIVPMAMDNVPYCEDEIFGKEKSFRFVYYPFGLTTNPNATRLSPVFSACMVRNDLTSPIAPTSGAGFNFPLIDQGFMKQPVEIHAYDSNNCSGTADIINFDQGHSQIAAGDRGLINTDASVGANGIIAYTIDSVLCAGSNLAGGTMFAGKDFVVNADGDTYIICTAEHFASLDTATAPGAGSGGILGHNNKDKFILGADITLPAAMNPIGDSMYQFKGKFLGSGFTITGVTKTHTWSSAGLFGYVGPGAEISDLVLDGFNYTFDNAGSSNHVGILAGYVVGNDVEISDIEINSSNVFLGTNTADYVYMGGAIGKVSVAAEERITIERVKLFNTSVDQATGAPGIDMFIGGLVGKSHSTAGGDIEFRDVAFEQGNVIAQKHVGGIAGMLEGNSRVEYGHVHANSTFGNMIVGHDKVGGLAGYMLGGSTIYSSIADVNIDVTLDSTTSEIGGAAGQVDNGQIIDSSIYVVMGKDSGTIAAANGTDYGGLVGRCQSGGGGPCVLKNNYIDFVTSGIAGDNTGGVVGNLMEGEVSYNYITGDIPYEGFDENGRGGIAGQSSTGQKMMFNYIDIGISGKTALGAFVGWGAGIIEYNYASPRITFWREDGGFDYGVIGGEIGNVDYNLNRAWGNVVESKFVTRAGTDCSSNCISLIGDPMGVDTDPGQESYKDNIFNGTVFYETLAGVESARTLGTGFIGDSGSAYANNYDLDGNSPSGGYSAFFDNLTSDSLPFFDSLATDRFLSFPIEMEEIGGMQGTNPDRIATFGNAVDPYPLGTCEDWDEIANSPFQHNKSFELTNDIFFNAGNGCTVSPFVPIGGPIVAGVQAIPFTGLIRANGWWLRNITMNVSISTGGSEVFDVGIIRKLGSVDGGFPGFVGSWPDPLVIKDSQVHIQAATADVSGGIAVGIGHVADGNVFLRVENSSLTVDSSATPGLDVGIGGVVGLFQQGFMANSGFYYSNDADASQVAATYIDSNHDEGQTTTAAVGGLIGTVGNRDYVSHTCRIDLEASLVKADVIAKDGYAGGVIGSVLDGGSTYKTDASLRGLVYNNYRSASAKYIENIDNVNDEGALIGYTSFGDGTSSLFLSGSMTKIPTGKIDISSPQSIGVYDNTGNVTIQSYTDGRVFNAALVFMEGAGSDSINRTIYTGVEDTILFTDNGALVIENELKNNGYFYDVEFNNDNEPTIYWEIDGIHMD